MPLPAWSIEFLRRSLDEVATRSGKPEAIEQIKKQATEILQDLPQSAARGIDAVLRTAEAGKKSVQRWSRKQSQLCRPLINGSGVLFHWSGSGVEVASEVLEVGYQVQAGAHSRGVGFERRLDDRLQKSMAAMGLSGEYRIAVAASLESAIAALIGLQRIDAKQTGATPKHPKLVMHRSDAIRLPSGRSLPDALNALVGTAGLEEGLSEVGSIDQRNAKDFEGIRDACVVSADLGQSAGGPFEDLPDDAIQVCIAPFHTLGSTSQPRGSANDPVTRIGSAEDLLRRGVDLVVISGNGFLGGPESGILIGRRGLVEHVEKTPFWRLIKASDAIIAMISEAVQNDCEVDPGDSAASETVGIASLSALEMIQVNEENLKARAERLATRLSGCDSISAVQVGDADATIVQHGRQMIRSRQLKIAHQEKTAEEWQAKLAEDLPTVLCTVEGSLLCVDLRWIPPSKDRLLAETLER